MKTNYDLTSTGNARCVTNTISYRQKAALTDVESNNLINYYCYYSSSTYNLTKIWREFLVNMNHIASGL